MNPLALEAVKLYKVNVKNIRDTAFGVYTFAEHLTHQEALKVYFRLGRGSSRRETGVYPVGIVEEV